MSEDDMARVQFITNFDYKPAPRLLYAYKAGETRTVKRECAALAIAQGRAIELDPPPRPKAARKPRKAAEK